VGEDDAAGRIRIYSPLDDKPKAVADPHRLARVRDVLARPEATLLIDRWSEDWDRLAWFRLDTSADLLEPSAVHGAAGEHQREHADAVARLRAKYPQYARHRLEDRPLLRFTVERIISWASRPDEDG
jgi:coenzyme F420-0:L-glutamate ligase/coenzyme F420-1:gamma-L-glutamate ligase